LDALKDIFSKLLQSCNQVVVPGSLSNPGLATLNDFLFSLVDYLRPQKIKYLVEKEAWLKHIRPLAAWLHESIKGVQSTGITGTRSNVGIAFTRVLLKLEVRGGYQGDQSGGVDLSIQVLLLPYPILALSPSDPHLSSARSLSQIGL
jgi:hypothetical protein